MNTTKRKNVIVKGVLALIMAAIVLFASACGSFWGASETPLDPDNAVTDPSGNNGSNTPDSQYSQILQDVLKSEYYNDIISKYKDGKITEVYEQITQYPFKLFEDIGIDVSALKAGQLSGSSFAYIKGNDTHNLYVNSRVEGNSGTPYYHCVTACYELSEQEYNDLSMLYTHGYIQAPFFVQELSYAKEPKFFTHSKISVTAYKSLLTTYKNSLNLTTNIFGTNDVELFLNSFSVSQQLFEVSVVHTEKKRYSLGGNPVGKGKICTTEAWPSVSGIKITTLPNDSSVFTGPTQLWNINWQDYQKSCTDITCFNSRWQNVLATQLLK